MYGLLHLDLWYVMDEYIHNIIIESNCGIFSIRNRIKVFIMEILGLVLL